METKPVLKIWIADDDSDDLEYMKFLFDRHAEFSLTACYQSADAVLSELRKGYAPDVLLTDFYMPVMTGAELTQRILDDQLAANMHIFIISSVINETSKAALSGCPQVRFIAKPSNLAEINDIPGLILENIGLQNCNKI